MEKFSGVKIIKFFGLLIGITAILAILNSLFSETIAGGIFSLYPFVEHEIFIPDIMVPITIILTIIELPLVVLVSASISERRGNWKLYLNIFLTFYLALLTVSLLDLALHVGDNFIGFIISLGVSYFIYYSIFKKFQKEPDQLSQTESNISQVKNKTLFFVIATFLLFVFGVVGFLIFIFVVIFVLCGGEGTGCKASPFTYWTFAIVLLATLATVWWKIVSKIKKHYE